MLFAGRAVAGAHALGRRRSRAVVAAALSHQRPVHRDRRAAGVGRQHRDAAPFQRVAMVATGRRASADVAQHGADDHRLPAEWPRAHAGAGGGVPRVRFGRSASAPLPPEQHRAFEQRFGISVVEAMGLTECASVAFANPLDAGARKIRHRPACRSASRRASSTPAGRVLAAGERGEIEVRGGNVMLGYYQVARCDGGGAARRRLACHRRPRLPRRGRLLLHHRPAEGADHQGRREHRAARDRRGAAARIRPCSKPRPSAFPTPRYGQEILACVVVKPGARCTEDELRAHCLRDARPLQDAAVPAARRRIAEGSVGQGAAPAGSSSCEAGARRCPFPLKTVRCRSAGDDAPQPNTRRATCARAAAASR